MTNKEKALYIINDDKSNSNYIALLIIKINGEFRFDIHSKDSDNDFNNLIDYINNLGDDLLISDNKEKIMSVTGFNDNDRFKIVIMSLYFDKFDNKDVWSDEDDKQD